MCVDLDTMSVGVVKRSKVEGRWGDDDVTLETTGGRDYRLGSRVRLDHSTNGTTALHAWFLVVNITSFLLS